MRFLHTLGNVALLGSLAAVAACASSAPGEPDLDRASSPIINGVESTAEDDSAVAVANAPVSGGFKGACSGVLISPNIVLTARHCVSQVQDGGIACSKDGKPIVGGNVVRDYAAEDLAILVGPKLDFAGGGIAFAARGKKVVHSGAKNLCNQDIALVILDKPITTAPIAQIRLNEPPVKGEKILAVGWGVSNNSSGYGRRRRADIPIETVGPASGVGGGVGANEFQIGEGICSGDSGGPAYAMTTNAVLGVVSRGGNGNTATDPAYAACVDGDGYVTHNLYTRVDGFKDLILSVFAETGEEPWLEGGPDPRKKKLGEPCVSGDECRSTFCIQAADKQICSETCNADTPCPDGYECVAAGDTNLCAPKAPPVAQNQADSNTASSGGCAASPSSSAGAWPVLALGACFALAATRRRRGR